MESGEHRQLACSRRQLVDNNLAATAAPLVVQSLATTGCAENRRPQFLRDNASAVPGNAQGRALEIHPGGPPNFVMPVRTNVWPVAIAGYVWDRSEERGEVDACCRGR